MYIFSDNPSDEGELPSNKKSNYFRFAIAIATIPMIDAPTVTTGDNGACVAVGRTGKVVMSDCTGFTGIAIGFDIVVVVKGIGTAFPRWEALPVL
jgi:hypothetical protein